MKKKEEQANDNMTEYLDEKIDEKETISKFLDDKLKENGINTSSASNNSKKNFISIILSMQRTCSCGIKGHLGQKCIKCGDYF